MLTASQPVQYMVSYACRLIYSNWICPDSVGLIFFFFFIPSNHSPLQKHQCVLLSTSNADLGIGVCAAHTLPAAILPVPPYKGLSHQHSEHIGCLSVFYSSCHGHSVSDSPCSSVATLVCVCLWHEEGWVKMERKTGQFVWPFTVLPNQCHTSTKSA